MAGTVPSPLVRSARGRGELDRLGKDRSPEAFVGSEVGVEGRKDGADGVLQRSGGMGEHLG